MEKDKQFERTLLKHQVAKNTSAYVLPLGITSSNYGWEEVPIRRRVLGGYSMLDVKEKLERTDKYGKPEILKRRGVGITIYPRLLTLVNFYDQQVERLIEYKGLQNCEDNLFYYEEREKLGLIRDLETEIYDYLFNNGSDYIFGEINDATKEKVYSAIRGSQGENQRILKRLNQTIADYTTLNELKRLNTAHKRRTLTRFIVSR